LGCRGLLSPSRCGDAMNMLNDWASRYGVTAGAQSRGVQHSVVMDASDALGCRGLLSPSRCGDAMNMLNDWASRYGVTAGALDELRVILGAPVGDPATPDASEANVRACDPTHPRPTCELATPRHPPPR
jgi:hypothetical protein